MLDFLKEDNRLVLSYSGEQSGSNWIYAELAKGGPVTLRKTFTVSTNELISEENPEDEDAPVLFEIGSKEGEYYCMSKDVLGIKYDLFIHESVELTSKTFIAERNISIFSILGRLVGAIIRIGGPEETAIPEDAFTKLLQKFPNSYELTSYTFARVGAVISSYIATKKDYEEKYQQYMNRRASIKDTNAYQLVASAEIEKYTLLLSKLKNMLAAEDSYSEAQWQEEILQIILLLYPKYIHVFKGAPVRDTYSNKDRSIDFLLVDSTGNTDIIEIKKPFDKCIVTDRTYRDNYIPLRELSGTVMQIEKYIYYLNKWGKKGEEKLTSHYREQLGDGFTIRITNPGAIIIMGRQDGLSVNQRQDFEVIKRKYKNVIDIITYDDLLGRLDSTLKHWSRHK
ncbi:MAG: hypothetical protein AYP45_15915 [Candidatus Brocadia carolinensis]|uniref:Shedu protein SduA C-terminal domain-containing protein n=1 Tax=Candidatus Brocadia carolinensis TaxID=1004156 RepID=A0A1V4AQ60_9BACT|nr:MAG: hypothetical protein AYP45_15915 [Candidatus Brocadia caroliniensis]